MKERKIVGIARQKKTKRKSRVGRRKTPGEAKDQKGRQKEARGQKTEEKGYGERQVKQGQIDWSERKRGVER